MRKKKYKSFWLMISLVLLLILLVAGIKHQLTPSGKLTGVPTSITIIVEARGAIFEGENTNQESDNVFQIGPIPLDDNWYCYNSTYGGLKGGYDTDGNNVTETFSFRNKGSTSVDVLLSAEDFGNSTGYIDVSQNNGYFQIYIPSVGWKMVPDGSNTDADSIRDQEELCVVNDLAPDQIATGFDFRIKAPLNLVPGNYSNKLILTVYDNTTIDICSTVGTYVTP